MKWWLMGIFLNWKQFKEKTFWTCQSKEGACAAVVPEEGCDPFTEVIFVWTAIEKTPSFAAGEFPRLWKFQKFSVSCRIPAGCCSDHSLAADRFIWCSVHFHPVSYPSIAAGARANSISSLPAGSIQGVLRDPRHSLRKKLKFKASFPPSEAWQGLLLVEFLS